MLGALLAMLAKDAPAVDCILVLRVSRGNSARVETQEAMPPARAAVSSILLVFFSLLRSEGGGPEAHLTTQQVQLQSLSAKLYLPKGKQSSKECSYSKI